MESNITRFAWGGSLAFRSDLLEDEDLKEFSSSISDDISLLNICRRKGLKVAYVKDARVLIHSNDNFKIFLEWSNRQTALSVKLIPYFIEDFSGLYISLHNYLIPLD